MDTTCVTFYLESSDQATEQAVLAFCVAAKTTAEIMEYLGLNHREHFRSVILKPLLDKGLLSLTIPDKPTSPNQKYITVSNNHA